jgi:hypothetical protein
MIDVIAAVKSAEELDKAIDIVEKLVGKLKAQPDLAAEKLGQALGEIAKTLQVVDNSASQFLSLGIDDGALTKNSKLLLDIDGGSLRTEVERGRGHCHLPNHPFRLHAFRIDRRRHFRVFSALFRSRGATVTDLSKWNVHAFLAVEFGSPSSR